MPSAPLLWLGVVLLILAAITRLAGGLPPAAPLPLAAGLALAEVRPPPEGVIEVGIGVSVVVLLFLLGLGHRPADRALALRASAPAGVLDAVLNTAPGAVAGLVLGFGAKGAVLLAAVTWASSWGITMGLLRALGRTGNRETPALLSVLVVEQLALAGYLPFAAALLIPGDAPSLAWALVASAAAVVAAACVSRLWARGGSLREALRPDLASWLSGPRGGQRTETTASWPGHPPSVGTRIGKRVGAVLRRLPGTPGALVLGAPGLALAVAGIAIEAEVTAGAAALLAGVALSGAADETGESALVLAALTGLAATAALFFFGLAVGGAALPGAAGPALVLAAATTPTKVATGWFSAARLGAGSAGRLRAGVTLVARGELSVAFAALWMVAGLDERLPAVVAAYVLLSGVGGPLLARAAGRLTPRRAPVVPAAGPRSRWSAR